MITSIYTKTAVLFGLMMGLAIPALAGGGGGGENTCPTRPVEYLDCQSADSSLKFQLVTVEALKCSGGYSTVLTMALELDNFRASNMTLYSPQPSEYPQIVQPNTLIALDPIGTFDPNGTIQFTNTEAGVVSLSFSEKAQSFGAPASLSLPFTCERY